MVKIATAGDEASCIISCLVAETSTPCPCRGESGLRICGRTHDGRPVEIRITEPGVMEIIGIEQEEVDAIRARRCLNC